MTAVKKSSSLHARLARPEVQPVLGAALFVLLLCLALPAVGIWSSWQARSSRIMEGEVAAANLTRAVEQHMNDALTSADMLLVGIVHEVQMNAGREHALEDLNSTLASQAAALPQLAGLYVFDEKGRWVANSLRVTPENANSSDRDYFRYHRDHVEMGPYIGPAIRGRVSSNWLLTISRRIEHPDGTFAGVALASIPLSYFEKFYARFDIDRHGVIAVLRDDGIMLTRRPFIESGIGADFSGSAIFQDYLKQPSYGMSRQKSAVDGMERLYAYRHSERYPLLVSAALAESDVLENWWNDTLAHAAGLLLLTLGLAIIGLRFIRQLRLRLQVERRLVESERRVRTVTDNLPVLISYIDRDKRFRFVNATLGKWLGTPAQELLGRPVAEVIGPELFAERQEQMDAVLAGKRVEFDIESASRGLSRHMHTTYVPQLDEDGVAQGFYALSMDVSALRTSEARIRAITDNLPALIAYVDTDQRMRFCNRYFHELPGLAAGDPVGKSLADIHGPVAHAALAPFVKAALAGERMAFEHALGEGEARRMLQLEYLPDRDGSGRILGFYLLATDITSQKRTEAELQRLARFDGLTGLPNRSQLRERLAQALERGDRSGRRIAVMFLDIDHFKAINDSLGHEGGDQVLKEFARRLSGCVRATDLVARLAGDEFVILLEGLHDAAEVALVANKIIDAMQPPFAVGDMPQAVSTSIGIVVRGPAEPADPDILLRHADEALYAAKRAGRNTWEMQPA